MSILCISQEILFCFDIPSSFTFDWIFFCLQFYIFNIHLDLDFIRILFSYTSSKEECTRFTLVFSLVISIFTFFLKLF